MPETKVLVVDDDTDVLMMLVLRFEKAGAQVVSCQSPLVALENVVSALKSSEPFDLIVLDIRMPEMNGNDLTRKIREAGHEGGIVAFTSSANEEGQRESSDAGFDDYLSKETVSVELIQTLLTKHSRGV